MNEKGITFLVTADQIGISETGAGQNLMKIFLGTLVETSKTPSYILLINTAVKLVADDSYALDSLKALVGSGCTILACGMCLDHYGVADKQAVGKRSNMVDIQAVINSEAKTVTL
ncbi:MAG: hypothetical protein LBC73_07965 [Oscillospiraceae bacterium]|jgi:hypothetical protein|nr:hypothetical protein [Oscillospiraceae bacterium]